MNIETHKYCVATVTQENLARRRWVYNTKNTNATDTITPRQGRWPRDWRCQRSGPCCQPE